MRSLKIALPELILKHQHTAHSDCSIHRKTVTEQPLLQAPLTVFRASNSALLVLVVSVVVGSAVDTQGFPPISRNPTAHPLTRPDKFTSALLPRLSSFRPLASCRCRCRRRRRFLVAHLQIFRNPTHLYLCTRGGSRLSLRQHPPQRKYRSPSLSIPVATRCSTQRTNERQCTINTQNNSERSPLSAFLCS